ncbi:helix-turn-helix domain-containing protein [Streptomyces sp. XM83C]|jgi:transcriptional regulator with XRE-family HTH domain|uniref:helix-turn-helix domain-containing protein n=1 Tax=Streptomyces sp. XM83C TaxID=2929781 RepID=UPI001FF92A4E|nr:helix-turn-helix transcriptional regulator [Streptomyces sp. XM83C]MCK1820713.1 helix-turn-helix domain-containing protein [Streptomyces sp. XM83C]
MNSAQIFGELLRHFRESAYLTQEALAKAIPCDRSLVARVEAATRVPQEPFAKKADEILGTGGVLHRLWGRIDWYPQVEHPDWFKRRAEMDARAVALREYQERLVPGLLQTEDYARALFGRKLQKVDEVEERVRARLSRQQRFLADGGPFYFAVLDESCLRTVVGGASVMRDQCAHLLAVGGRSNIRIQIAPAGRPGLVRPNTSMSLIELPDGHRWVYSESLDRGHFNDDPAVYQRHFQAYDVLRADVPSARESAAVIRNAMEAYEHHEQERTRRDQVDQEQLQRRQRRQLRGNRPRYPRRRPRT